MENKLGQIALQVMRYVHKVRGKSPSDVGVEEPDFPKQFYFYLRALSVHSKVCDNTLRAQARGKYRKLLENMLEVIDWWCCSSLYDFTEVRKSTVPVDHQLFPGCTDAGNGLFINGDFPEDKVFYDVLEEGDTVEFVDRKKAGECLGFKYDSTLALMTKHDLVSDDKKKDYPKPPVYMINHHQDHKETNCRLLICEKEFPLETNKNISGVPLL